MPSESCVGYFAIFDYCHHYNIVIETSIITISWLLLRFFWMRRKDSRFTLWGLGVWGCVRSTLSNRSPATGRNRSQPSASVRVRSLWRVVQKWPLLEVSRIASRSFILCRRCCTSCVMTFRRVSSRAESHFVSQCSTFATFSEDALHVSWQARHFGDLHRHFAWQMQHFRAIALHVVSNRIVRPAWNGDNVQIPWQVWLWDVMTVLRLLHASPVFFCRCRVMGQAAKPLLFEGFHAGCHVSVGQAWHFLIFQHVS